MLEWTFDLLIIAMAILCLSVAWEFMDKAERLAQRVRELEKALEEVNRRA